jgi:hypothetical protein
MTIQLNIDRLKSLSYNKYTDWDQQTQLATKGVQDLLIRHVTTDLLNPITRFLNQVLAFINNQVCKCKYEGKSENKVPYFIATK